MATYVEKTFKDLDLKDVKLKEATFQGCVFENITVESSDDCKHMTFKNCKFINCTVLLYDAHNAMVYDCDFANCYFNGNIEVSYFKNCSFISTTICRSAFKNTFENCDFGNCYFRVSLVTADFENCKLVDTDFGGKRIPAENMVNCYINNIHHLCLLGEDGKELLCID